jgi:hypothetical protein
MIEKIITVEDIIKKVKDNNSISITDRYMRDLSYFIIEYMIEHIKNGYDFEIEKFITLTIAWDNYNKIKTIKLIRHPVFQDLIEIQNRNYKLLKLKNRKTNNNITKRRKIKNGKNRDKVSK